MFLLISFVSFGLRINREYRHIETEKETIEKQKANAEIAFLKAQINPHFLFNSLNSIYGLAIIQSKQTADSVLKLSNIMRYVISEAHTPFVPLENELAYIESYIELQKLRLTENNRIDFEVQGTAAELEISPLLLIPFVENAFKYGISPSTDTLIRICIEINTNELLMTVSNAKLSTYTEYGVGTGLGIENTIKRLDLIYKDRYNLSISEDDQNYLVRLSIGLKVLGA